MIDKELVKKTVEWLECYLDELDDKSEAAEVQSVINFWRLYLSFL